MIKLTDLEICKRVAEIKGKKLEPSSHGSYYKVKSTIYPFNPLEDDALCYELQDKFNISIVVDDDGFWAIPKIEHFAAGDTSGRFDFESSFAVFNENKKKAICLAIIEAHKDD